MLETLTAATGGSLAVHWRFTGGSLAAAEEPATQRKLIPSSLQNNGLRVPRWWRSMMAWTRGRGPAAEADMARVCVADHLDSGVEDRCGQHYYDQQPEQPDGPAVTLNDLLGLGKLRQHRCPGTPRRRLCPPG